MDQQALQARIDAIRWYHEFDFPGGLRARVDADYADFHRKLWRFTRERLDTIDFRGKSVLDIGCWDGYWSFYAEQRGAASVLATDDTTQSWADGDGLRLARELLGSKIDVDLERNVYDLASLDRRFDVILFLGVYYHLHSPFYALAQVRKLCGPGTVVVVEGDVRRLVGTEDAQFCFAKRSPSTFMPSVETMEMMLAAAYFSVDERHFYIDHYAELARRQRRSVLARWGERLRAVRDRVAPRRPEPFVDRAIFVCRPFEGENPMHYYSPPFGLDRYDPRYRH